MFLVKQVASSRSQPLYSRPPIFYSNSSSSLIFIFVLHKLTLLLIRPSNMSVQPRTSYLPPQHADKSEYLPTSVTHRVQLRHPGYPDAANIFMILAALDHPVGGIRHEIARIACAIVSNNRFDGFLSETKTGKPVQVGPGGILFGKNYYFRVPGDSRSSPHFRWTSFSLLSRSIPSSTYILALAISARENTLIMDLLHTASSGCATSTSPNGYSDRSMGKRHHL